MIIDSPVFPIVPSYDKDGDLESQSKYLDYLANNKVKIIMTTAGTSQFNLLSDIEITELNSNIYTYAHMFDFFIMGLNYNHNNYWISKDIGLKNVAYLLQYSERYYSDKEIINYFYSLAEKSLQPIFIHCLPLRDGRGKGQYVWTADLINKLCEHENIIGIKEETPDLMQAYDICSKINKDKCQIICAGGSQRRFELLKNTGVQSFLAGVGSIWPTVDLDGNTFPIDEKKIYLNDNFEDECFDLFFKIGWHPALRHALKLKGLISDCDRQPYYQLTQEEKDKIKTWFDNMEYEMDENA